MQMFVITLRTLIINYLCYTDKIGEGYIYVLSLAPVYY